MSYGGGAILTGVFLHLCGVWIVNATKETATYSNVAIWITTVTMTVICTSEPLMIVGVLLLYMGCLLLLYILRLQAYILILEQVCLIILLDHLLP